MCHSHGNSESELHLKPMPQLVILNPLSKARDRIHILEDTSQILNLLSHNGNSKIQIMIQMNPIVKNKLGRNFVYVY